MRNISSKADGVGDTLPAGDFNANLRSELQNVVTDAGITLDPEGGADTDLHMLGKAIATYGASVYYEDSGAVNAYVLSRVGNLQVQDAYFDGMVALFLPGNTNTGASTVNINTIGSKSITLPDGTALSGGELNQNTYQIIVYNLSDDRFELIGVASGSAVGSVTQSIASTLSGYLRCDGRTPTQAAYPALYAVIGDSYYGSDNWSTVPSADAYSNAWQGVTYGDGKFVAVGQSAEIQLSYDGYVWTHSEPDASFSSYFYAVTYGKGLFIAVGVNGEIQTSPNAVTWTQQTAAGTDTFYGVTYGNGMFVAVGASGAIETSPDGITWTARTAAGSYAGVFSHVTYGNGLFVAVGTSSAEIQTSPDGITWTARTAGSSYAYRLQSVLYDESLGLFVVVGGNTAPTDAEIQTSPDGITWTARTVPGTYTSELMTVSNGSGMLIARGYGNGVVYSYDAVTWVHDSFTTYLSYSACCGNGRFVASTAAGSFSVKSGSYFTAGDFRVPLIMGNINSFIKY